MKHTLFLLAILCLLHTEVQAQKYLDNYHKGNYVKALEQSKKAIDKDKKDMDAYLVKAMCYMHLGTDTAYKSEYGFGVETALSSLKYLINKDRNNTYMPAHAAEQDSILQAGYDKARSYFAQGDDKRCAKVVDRIMDIETTPECLYFKGSILIHDGETDDGMDMYNAAAARIYKEYVKNGVQPDPFLLKTFTAFAMHLGEEDAWSAAYTISNRAGKVFHSSESDAAYIALLEKQMENTDQYSTDDWFVDFIQNLDTVNTYVTDPEIFADLKWGMIEDYYVFSYHREQADSAFNWMMRYTCAEQKVDMIDFIARQISYDTYVYNNSNGISVEGSDPEFGLWKEILSCLHPGNDANNDLSAYIRTLISDGAFMLSAELLYNAKRNGMPKNISQDLEKRLYDAISMDSAAELSHVDLYYISKYLPGNSYISSLQQNASIAAIDKYIAQNKFSEAGALLRQQIAEYPNDKTINMLYVQWVMQDYAVNYIGSMTPYDMLAVSDPDNCKAGKLSKECQDLFLKRLNYVRRLAGVPDQCGLREEWNKKCQDAALMMQANYSLSHGPPDTWSCYSASGYEGASHSNLSLGEAGSAALMGQVDDYGSNNTSVGHRRWILNPYRKVYGHGSNTSSMALWALGGTDSNYPDSLTDKYDNQFVAWPPAYYCPLPFFTHRWSFSLSNVDFSETTVEMYRGNKKIKVEVLEQEFGYGQNTIVWEPDMEYYLNSPDTFKIVLKHVKQYTYDPVTYERQERDETYTYTVQFIQVN